MRFTRLAVPVVIASAAGIACETEFENYTPPPTPPTVKTYTLTSASHELADESGNLVLTSYKQLSLAQRVWRSCGISVPFAATLFEELSGPDPAQGGGNVYVRFGEKFPAEYPNKDAHGPNWTIVRNEAFRLNAAQSKGSDDHWTKRIQTYNEGLPDIVSTLGVTPVTPGPDNVSVVRSLENGNEQLILGHEIGHQLGLSDLEPQGNTGNLMCKAIGCSGTTLTGHMGTPNPRAPYTQCERAIYWGDLWDLYEEA